MNTPRDWRYDHRTRNFVFSVAVFFVVSSLVNKAFDSSESWSSCLAHGLFSAALWAVFMWFVVWRRRTQA